MAQFVIDQQGVGRVIQSRLGVPHYQRSYAWGDYEGRDQVQDFWEDLESAFLEGGPRAEYFLGSVVLAIDLEISDGPNSSGVQSRKALVDGQQRLTTTTLLVAAIRDYFKEKCDDRHRTIHQSHIALTDLRSNRPRSNLELGVEDNSFFQQLVVDSGPNKTNPKPTKRSHELLLRAYDLLRARVADLAVRAGDSWGERLVDLLDFIDDRARVITVTVPTVSDAYLIFETLNDRGVDLTISDLTKNYIFSKAKDRLSECQAAWSEAAGALESVANKRFSFTDFLRHYFGSTVGPTRERELFARIKESNLKHPEEAVRFAECLRDSAVSYAHLLQPKNSSWKGYSRVVQESLSDLQILEVERIRPLLLAASECLSRVEFEKFSRYCVSAVVRMRVSGAEGSVAERRICDAAVAVRDGSARTAAQAIRLLGDAVPGDRQFEISFGNFSVRRNVYSRYYLMRLEAQIARNSGTSEGSPADGSANVSIEHVLPRKAGVEWKDISDEDRGTLVHRLGNQVLLDGNKNRELANSAFVDKREVYFNSPLALTKEVGKEEYWGANEVDQRQRRLAKLAVAAWPLPDGR